jgi:hypothetical protein
VHVEHAFAALKGRFQSLQELQHNIQTAKDLQFIVHWIQCCIILHNMIIRLEANHNQDSQAWAQKEGNTPMSHQFEDADGNEVVGDRSYAGTPGQACRATLMNQLFDSLSSGA